eukprot:jgi/Botrbrau1/20095/Bobra.0548s0001.1
MTSRQVVEFVDHYLRHPCGGISPAAALTLEAMNRCKRKIGVTRVDDVTAIVVPLPAYDPPHTESTGTSSDDLPLPKILKEEPPQSMKEANASSSQLVILSLPDADYFHFAEAQGEKLQLPKYSLPRLPTPVNKANPRKLIRSRSEKALRRPARVINDVIEENEPFTGQKRGLCVQNLIVPKMYMAGPSEVKDVAVRTPVQPGSSQSGSSLDNRAARTSTPVVIIASEAAATKSTVQSMEPILPTERPQRSAGATVAAPSPLPVQTSGIPIPPAPPSAWGSHNTAPEKLLGRSRESPALDALMRRCASEFNLRSMEGRCHGSSALVELSFSRPSVSAPPELMATEASLACSASRSGTFSQDNPGLPRVAMPLTGTISAGSKSSRASDLLSAPGQRSEAPCLSARSAVGVPRLAERAGQAAIAGSRGSLAQGLHSALGQAPGTPSSSPRWGGGRPSPPLAGVACGMDPALGDLDPTTSSGQRDGRVHRGSSALQLLKTSGTTNVCH